MAIEDIIARGVTPNVAGQFAAGRQFAQQQQMGQASLQAQQLANRQAQFTLDRAKANAPFEDLNNYLQSTRALAGRFDILDTAQSDEEKMDMYASRVYPFAQRFMPEGALPEPGEATTEAIDKARQQLMFDMPSLTELSTGFDDVRRLASTGRTAEAQELARQLVGKAEQMKGEAVPIYDLEGNRLGLGKVLSDGSVVNQNNQPYDLSQITTEPPPEGGDKKAIPMGSLEAISSGFDAIDNIETLERTVGVTGIGEGIASKAAAAGGLSQDAIEFDTAMKSLKLSLQSMIKGNPSDRDLQTLIDRLPQFASAEDLNKERIRNIRNTIETSLQTIYEGYDPDTYYISDKISDRYNRIFRNESSGSREGGGSESRSGRVTRTYNPDTGRLE